jgi:hypothetical protein
LSVEASLEMAREGRLYPAVILHGADDRRRRDAATRLGRALLCKRPAADRPCGDCRHCRRVFAEAENERFHPDFHVLERDQKTVTSIEATRRFLQAAQMAPYEARGQVFVVSAAETLGPEAADTLLKILEEPPPRTPRHFFLLTPSSRELTSTLRSRSMSLFLGGQEGMDDERLEALAGAFSAAVNNYLTTGAAVHLLAAAAALEQAGGWRDLRASAPWSLAASAVVRVASDSELPTETRQALLALASNLLEARSQRLRGITPQRILEGLVVNYLGGAAARPGVVAGP